jgi:hypothetical protein
VIHRRRIWVGSGILFKLSLALWRLKRLAMCVTKSVQLLQVGSPNTIRQPEKENDRAHVFFFCDFLLYT